MLFHCHNWNINNSLMGSIQYFLTQLSLFSPIHFFVWIKICWSHQVLAWNPLTCSLVSEAIHCGHSHCDHHQYLVPCLYLGSLSACMIILTSTSSGRLESFQSTSHLCLWKGFCRNYFFCHEHFSLLISSLLFISRRSHVSCSYSGSLSWPLWPARVPS